MISASHVDGLESIDRAPIGIIGEMQIPGLGLGARAVPGCKTPPRTAAGRGREGIREGTWGPTGRRVHSRRARQTRLAAKEDGGKESFGDELLDFMYAGKKLRKWYGETDMVLPRDGGPVDEAEDEGPEAPMEDIPRSSVVVLYPEDDRFPMSEQALLELIVRRADVLVVTNDTSRAKEGYGKYVNAVRLDSSRATRRALAGAKSVVVCGAVTKQVREVLKMASAPRVVLLVAEQDTGAVGGGVFGGLFESAERKELRNLEARRRAVAAPGCEVVEVPLGRQADRERTAQGVVAAALQ